MPSIRNTVYALSLACIVIAGSAYAAPVNGTNSTTNGTTIRRPNMNPGISGIHGVGPYGYGSGEPGWPQLRRLALDRPDFNNRPVCFLEKQLFVARPTVVSNPENMKIDYIIDYGCSMQKCFLPKFPTNSLAKMNISSRALYQQWTNMYHDWLINLRANFSSNLTLALNNTVEGCAMQAINMSLAAVKQKYWKVLPEFEHSVPGHIGLDFLNADVFPKLKMAGVPPNGILTYNNMTINVTAFSSLYYGPFQQCLKSNLTVVSQKIKAAADAMVAQRNTAFINSMNSILPRGIKGKVTIVEGMSLLTADGAPPRCCVNMLSYNKDTQECSGGMAPYFYTEIFKRNFCLTTCNVM